jgi:hypothetical protein
MDTGWDESVQLASGTSTAFPMTAAAVQEIHRGIRHVIHLMLAYEP